MSFATLAALAVALLVAAPVVAHLLKRGRTEQVAFPPARLVPRTPATSRKRSRLEDRALLAIRTAMVLALAVLGATPLITCSRLSVARPAGGNVALAIVLDDSQSMRNLTAEGPTRWEAGQSGARELLASTRQGDSVSLVLAGYPARAILPPTTDLALAARTLDQIEVSDRKTDLAAALQLAQGALENLPQADQRVILLTDLAGGALPDAEPRPWLPLPELRTPQSNCGIASAEQRGNYAQVTVACSNQRAAADRRLRLLDARGNEVDLETSDEPPAPAASAALSASASVPSPAAPAAPQPGEPELRPRPGVQALNLPLPGAPEGEDQHFSVALTGSDDNESDDQAPLSAAEQSLSVAIVADPDRGLANTGGRSLVEQALLAIDPHMSLRPLALMPQEATDLEPFAALIVDDPPGLSPEARLALDQWLTAGGVALGLLGPAAASSQLASNLVPFADGAVRWEEISDVSVLPDSVAWMGDEGDSLESLTRQGRLRLDGAVPSGATPLGTWEDRVPWLFERSVGQGSVVTAGLPSSVQHSDLALRPGFLALLSYLVEQAQHRSGPRRSDAGSAWTFAGTAQVSVEGPRGPLEVTRADACRGASAGQDCEVEEQRVEPALAGRYRVSVDGQPEERVVTIAPEELTELPSSDDSANDSQTMTSAGSTQVDASREIALLLLALLAAELGLRVTRRSRRAERKSAAPS